VISQLVRPHDDRSNCQITEESADQQRLLRGVWQ
jgi:hypothetical protein